MSELRLFTAVENVPLFLENDFIQQLLLVKRFRLMSDVGYVAVFQYLFSFILRFLNDVIKILKDKQLILHGLSFNQQVLNISNNICRA